MVIFLDKEKNYFGIFGIKTTKYRDQRQPSCRTCHFTSYMWFVKSDFCIILLQYIGISNNFKILQHILMQ